MTRYNTNLAAEFHVLSILHRLGADASLTLGNKKAVDIFVVRDTGESVTIDVKAVAGPWDWPADNIRSDTQGQHFIALVSFEGKIDSPESSPNVCVVPLASFAQATLRSCLREAFGRLRSGPGWRVRRVLAETGCRLPPDEPLDRQLVHGPRMDVD